MKNQWKITRYNFSSIFQEIELRKIIFQLKLHKHDLNNKILGAFDEIHSILAKKLEKPREKHGKFQLLTVFRKIDKRELFYDTVLIYKSILTKKSEELSRFFPYQFENGEKLSKTKEIAPH